MLMMLVQASFISMIGVHCSIFGAPTPIAKTSPAPVFKSSGLMMFGGSWEPQKPWKIQAEASGTHGGFKLLSRLCWGVPCKTEVQRHRIGGRCAPIAIAHEPPSRSTQLLHNSTGRTTSRNPETKANNPKPSLP